MIDINSLSSQISKEFGVDKNIVNDVIRQVFDCTATIMKDPNDKRDILFAKLFKFKLKPKFKHEDYYSGV